MAEHIELVVDGLHARVRFEEGGFWATIDEHAGVFAIGNTLEELRDSLREGISLAKSSLLDDQAELRRRDARLRERLRLLREEENRIYDLLGGVTNAQGTPRAYQMTSWTVIRARMLVAQMEETLQKHDPDWALIKDALEDLRRVVDDEAAGPEE